MKRKTEENCREDGKETGRKLTAYLPSYRLTGKKNVPFTKRKAERKLTASSPPSRLTGKKTPP